jgi:hypothetical protein
MRDISYPNILEGRKVLMGGTAIRIMRATIDRKKNGRIPLKMLSSVRFCPSGI